MKILVTGNMGYIGPTVMRQLRSSYPQATLVGLDTGYFAHCLTNSPQLPESRIDVQYFEDVRDVTVERLQGVDAVVHLAAISNDPMGNKYEEVTAAINHRASVNIARLAKQANAVDLFEFGYHVVVQLVLVVGDTLHADSLQVVDSGAETDGARDIGRTGFELER